MLPTVHENHQAHPHRPSNMVQRYRPAIVLTCPHRQMDKASDHLSELFQSVFVIQSVVQCVQKLPTKTCTQIINTNF